MNVWVTIKTFLEFFDIHSLVNHEYVLSGQSVTDHFYVPVLQRLSDAA
jgi:hypothetical protein